MLASSFANAEGTAANGYPNRALQLQKHLPLLLPAIGDRPLQHLQVDASRLATGKYHFHNVRSQQSHAQKPADIGAVDLFLGRNFINAFVEALLHQLAPAEPPGNRFYKRSILATP